MRDRTRYILTDEQRIKEHAEARVEAELNAGTYVSPGGPWVSPLGPRCKTCGRYNCKLSHS